MSSRISEIEDKLTPRWMLLQRALVEGKVLICFNDNRYKLVDGVLSCTNTHGDFHKVYITMSLSVWLEQYEHCMIDVQDH